MSILDGPAAQPAQAAQPAAQPVQQVDPLAGPATSQPQQSSGGFLNDLGVNWDNVSASNDPTDGTHRCFVTKSEIRIKQKDQSKQWVITYRVADGEPQAGKTKDEWRPVPVVANGHFASDKDSNNASWLKARLMSLGVPEARVGSTNPQDLMGIECYVTLRTKDGWQNVVAVKTASEVQAAQNSLGGQPTGNVQGLI